MCFVVSCSKSGKMKLTHARSVMFTGQAHFSLSAPLDGSFGHALLGSGFSF